MKNYQSATKYLNSFINYERKVFFPYKKNLKLKRVKKLLHELSIPFDKLKVIHIAGTKGKGSTATFCANILASSGFRVGLYTSPHLVDFRERIAILKKNKKGISKTLISKNDVIRIVNNFKPKIEKLRFTSKFGKVTFFEVYTAIAFKYFLEKNVDFVVLETGLGGRLDATNVINRPLISIITHIDYDHMDKLGNRLAQIAYEKAGIIKKKSLVISNYQRKSALKVILKKAKKEKAQFFLYKKDFFCTNIRFYKNCSYFDFRFKNFELKNLKISLLGPHQIENVALALAAIYLLKEKKIIEEEINYRGGLLSSYIEGRFEIIKKNPLVILDVAHNPAAFGALAKNLKLYFPKKKIILIFAVSKDKDIKNMLNKLSGVDKYIFTSFSNPRSVSPQDIKKVSKISDAILTKDIKEAFRIAIKFYKKNYLILISGSLFLVGDAKNFFKRCRCLN
ncbi:MAG: bifunctional folylpolyglutamate synthase/dihydrofolate synthase [Candidatus Omnitrophica bacterium]|nr:bifunctional folylpolyglutamate synthase/dihydrofolate synthase [Candidatus Omnitrophota bacterium]